ncbi:MAG: glycosyltransferase family 9 protein [SAR324 cluster bacterium]|nr:glycosyltransferase family 9 protein [SAR324 cluster bacterium]
MKYRYKLLVDRYLGSVVCFLIAPLVKGLDYRLNRNRSNKNSPIRHIAVLKILGMGSILQSQTMVQTFRRYHPGVRITLITSMSNRPMTERLPEMFDDYLFLRDQSGWTLAIDTFRTIWWSWKTPLDLYLDLELYSSFASFLCGISLTPRRFGFYRNVIAFRSWIHTNLIYFNNQKHISESYIQFALADQLKVSPEWNNPIQLKSDDLEETESWLRTHQIKEPFIVVNVNSSELMLERRWSAVSFANLIKLILDHFKMTIVLMGSPTERTYVEDVRQQIPVSLHQHVLNSSGEVSLGGCLGLIQKCSLMITNDSGPFHFAVCLGTKLIGLFGPCDPQQYGTPFSSEDIRIHYAGVYCSPCIHNTFDPPCGGDNICMKRISVESVWEDVEKILDSVLVQNKTETGNTSSGN